MTIDFQLLISILVPLGVALVISFIATPLVKTFAHKVGAIDVPNDERRVHNHPIPRLGGLAIFLGFLISVVLFADIERQVQGILFGAVIIVIVGVIDDIVPLPALLKFVIQIGAALVAVYFGVRIEIISNPNIFSSAEYVSFGAWSIPITVIWIVAITNSVNFIDGLDGLACGVSTIASITMLVIAIFTQQFNVAIILAALTGSCLGFIPYNLNPAKIFMGDTGSLLLGYLLATLSITGVFKFYAIISFAVPFLALGLPIFDILFAVIRRLIKGQNPMHPDRGHFHHRLIDMGLNQKQAVAILYILSAVLGLTAVIMTTSGEMKALVLVVAFAMAAVIVMAIMKISSNNPKNTESTTEGIPEKENDPDIQPESDNDEEDINP